MQQLRAIGAFQIANGIFLSLGTLLDEPRTRIVWALMAVLWVAAGGLLMIKNPLAKLATAVTTATWMLLAVAYGLVAGYTLRSGYGIFMSAYMLSVLVVQLAGMRLLFLKKGALI
jgi:hypothetical protein